MRVSFGDCWDTINLGDENSTPDGFGLLVGAGDELVNGFCPVCCWNGFTEVFPWLDPIELKGDSFENCYWG